MMVRKLQEDKAAMQDLREKIALEILSWHTPNDNTTHCLYGDCTHEEDAAIARGEL